MLTCSHSPAMGGAPGKAPSPSSCSAPRPTRSDTSPCTASSRTSQGSSQGLHSVRHSTLSKVALLPHPPSTVPFLPSGLPFGSPRAPLPARCAPRPRAAATHHCQRFAGSWLDATPKLRSALTLSAAQHALLGVSALAFLALGMGAPPPLASAGLPLAPSGLLARALGAASTPRQPVPFAPTPSPSPASDVNRNGIRRLSQRLPLPHCLPPPPFLFLFPAGGRNPRRRLRRRPHRRALHRNRARLAQAPVRRGPRAAGGAQRPSEGNRHGEPTPAP